MPRTSSSAARLSALAAALLMCAACRHKPAEQQAEPAPVAPAAQAPTGDPVELVYPAAPGSFVDVADQVQRGVVAIKSTRKVIGGPGDDFAGIDDPYALGSGFLIPAGYILTNDHVVADAAELRVVLYDGSERAATVAGRDTRLDIALLEIDGSPRGLQPLSLGGSARARIGEWVVAVGDPFGLGATVSAGVLSGKGSQPIGPNREYQRSYLQTDASIHSGNSGGPLVDMKGEVIGINTAVTKRGTPVSYAIPIDVAKQILPQLKSDGVVSRAWLGAFVKPVTDELARTLGMNARSGAFVSKVVNNGPAARAGIHRGDVILEYDQHDVDDKSLAWIASTTGIGRTIRIVVWRDGGKRQLDLVTAKMPE